MSTSLAATQVRISHRDPKYPLHHPHHNHKIQMNDGPHFLHPHIVYAYPAHAQGVDMTNPSAPLVHFH